MSLRLSYGISFTKSRLTRPATNGIPRYQIRVKGQVRRVLRTWWCLYSCRACQQRRAVQDVGTNMLAQLSRVDPRPPVRSSAHPRTSSGLDRSSLLSPSTRWIRWTHPKPFLPSDGHQDQCESGTSRAHAEITESQQDSNNHRNQHQVDGERDNHELQEQQDKVTNKHTATEDEVGKRKRR